MYFPQKDNCVIFSADASVNGSTVKLATLRGKDVLMTNKFVVSLREESSYYLYNTISMMGVFHLISTIIEYATIHNLFNSPTCQITMNKILTKGSYVNLQYKLTGLYFKIRLGVLGRCKRITETNILNLFNYVILSKGITILSKYDKQMKDIFTKFNSVKLNAGLILKGDDFCKDDGVKIEFNVVGVRSIKTDYVMTTIKQKCKGYNDKDVLFYKTSFKFKNTTQTKSIVFAFKIYIVV